MSVNSRTLLLILILSTLQPNDPHVCKLKWFYAQFAQMNVNNRVESWFCWVFIDVHTTVRVQPRTAAVFINKYSSGRLRHVLKVN